MGREEEGMGVAPSWEGSGDTGRKCKKGRQHGIYKGMRENPESPSPSLSTPSTPVRAHCPAQPTRLAGNVTAWYRDCPQGYGWTKLPMIRPSEGFHTRITGMIMITD